MIATIHSSESQNSPPNIVNNKSTISTKELGIYSFDHCNLTSQKTNENYPSNSDFIENYLFDQSLHFSSKEGILEDQKLHHDNSIKKHIKKMKKLNLRPKKAQIKIELGRDLNLTNKSIKGKKGQKINCQKAKKELLKEQVYESYKHFNLIQEQISSGLSYLANKVEILEINQIQISSEISNVQYQ